MEPLGPSLFDEILTLSEAAQLCGLAAHTLTQQAEKGRLRARKIGRIWLTTRQWLAEYLATRSRRRARRGGPSTEPHPDRPE